MSVHKYDQYVELLYGHFRSLLPPGQKTGFVQTRGGPFLDSIREPAYPTEHIAIRTYCTKVLAEQGRVRRINRRGPWLEILK